MPRTAVLRSTPELRPRRRWGPAGPVFAPHGDPPSLALRKAARVLVVEDDHVVATDIESALLDAGFDVVGVAATADDAVAMAQAEKPDLAIMDIRLAGHRDGIDAALELLKKHGVRCIFATAHHDAATRLRAQPARPLGWVSKPYQAEAVVEAVRDALDDLSKP